MPSLPHQQFSSRSEGNRSPAAFNGRAEVLPIVLRRAVLQERGEPGSPCQTNLFSLVVSNREEAARPLAQRTVVFPSAEDDPTSDSPSDRGSSERHIATHGTHVEWPAELREIKAE